MTLKELCEQGLHRTAIASADQDRQTYEKLARAALRLERKGLWARILAREADRQLVRQYALDDYARITRETQAEAQVPGVDARALKAYEKLKSVDAAFFAIPAVSLIAYNRLTFLHAQIFDFLTTDKFESLYDSHLNHLEMEWMLGAKPAVSILESSQEVLLGWVREGNGTIVGTGPAAKVGPDASGSMEIPTFTQPSLRLSLWGISRGIYFTRQITEHSWVDGREYRPSSLAAHDFNLAWEKTHFDYDRRSARLWDRLEAKLENSGLSGVQVETVMALLYAIFHENKDYPMICESISGRTGNLQKHLGAEIQNRILLQRLNQKDGLGRAMSEPVTDDGLRAAMDFTVTMLKEACP